jgi:hypothetical protein
MVKKWTPAEMNRNEGMAESVKLNGNKLPAKAICDGQTGAKWKYRIAGGDKRRYKRR